MPEAQRNSNSRNPKSFSLGHPFQLLVAVCLASCASDASKPIPASEIKPTPSYDQNPIDLSVNACDNFYQHACGSWIKENELPAGKMYISLQEDKAKAENERAMQNLLEGTDSGNQETDRLRTFFASCMARPEGGSVSDRKIIDSWSQKILDIKTRAEFWKVWQDLQKSGINAFLAYSGELDWSNWKSFQGQIHQGRFGLYPQSLYNDSAAESKRAVADYQARIEKSFMTLRGAPKGQSVAREILRIETALAAASIPRNDLFKPERSKHPMKLSELESKVPAVPWSRFFELVGNPGSRTVNVTSPAYLKALNEILEKESVENLRDFLLWQWLDQLGPYLPGSLAGDPAIRRQDCRMATIHALGVELSRQFALKYIGSTSRNQGKEIAVAIQKTISESVRDLDWLSPEARLATSEKIAATDIKAGFPDEWPAVGSFALGNKTFLKNIVATQSYEQERSWARAQKPRNRSSWEMKVYPTGAHGMAAARLMIYNGFPDAFSNSIILTAASLQKPRLDPAAPLEVQYGGFGGLVAHELTHVLEFPSLDKTGAPSELWKEADYDAHKKQRTDCLTAQVAEYRINGQSAMDPAKTLSENVADLSGVKYAYRSMTRALPNFGARSDRNSVAQRFFYAYAHHWCVKESTGMLASHGHAPAEFRVNGPLANLPEFAEAFGCQAGTKMVRPSEIRCSVW